jgi:hypothetical protein
MGKVSGTLCKEIVLSNTRAFDAEWLVREVFGYMCDPSPIESKAEWTGLKNPVKIESERYIKSTGKTEEEIRLYIGSFSTYANSEIYRIKNCKIRVFGS